MYCLFLLCASLFINLPHTCVCQALVDPLPFERVIQDYFKSESKQQLRQTWETIRKPVEHALVTALKDSVGLPGMNLYVRKVNEKLAAGFFHNDNQVQVILRDVDLEDMPRCVFPDIQFSLGSNVLKVHTGLSKMVIHTDYVLIRNKTDIIHNPKNQDPLNSSPFLFEQVQDTGKVAITMDNCELKGFVTVMIDGDSIDLGHDRFKIHNCRCTVEIYRPGQESPPVIALYNLSENGHGLSLIDLVKMRLVRDELIPKLQSAIYSVVNASAIFGSGLHEYEENQEIVFLLTKTQLSEVARQMNKLTIDTSQESIDMPDYKLHWDDGKIMPSNNEPGGGETLKLKEMVLTGLDTVYSTHAGGPIQLDTVRIADKLCFSSLQVRGKLEIRSTWSDIFDFAAEISDFTMELHIQLPESNKNRRMSRNSIKDRQIEVDGIRRMTFTVPTVMFESAKSFLSGYLLREVPLLVRSHTIAMFDKTMEQRTKTEAQKNSIGTLTAPGQNSVIDFGSKTGNDGNLGPNDGDLDPNDVHESKHAMVGNEMDLDDEFSESQGV